jgi:glyoxalase family protein
LARTHKRRFRVPWHSLGYWTHRFVEKGVAHQALAKRFGGAVLPFTDPDGMRLALDGVKDAENEAGWNNGDVPAERAIRGFHGVTLLLDDAVRTGAILTDVLGLPETGREGSVVRFAASGTQQGGIVCQSAFARRITAP